MDGEQQHSLTSHESSSCHTHGLSQLHVLVALRARSLQMFILVHGLISTLPPTAGCQQPQGWSFNQQLRAAACPASAQSLSYVTSLVTAYLPPTQLEAAGQACEVSNTTKHNKNYAVFNHLRASEMGNWGTSTHFWAYLFQVQLKHFGGWSALAGSSVTVMV